uniref:AlNc14C61G4449 protein n=1 Tax=Albugo laibachii Nc14 TaxID=890382 RepID=F0WCS2_9STRA|nr:AlNc14C61G4449 [Albugo laibachii Nc14]|eukprot:CCA18991.1 AlNc14C61G4449 [Albugo laibachii Nc14]
MISRTDTLSSPSEIISRQQETIEKQVEQSHAYKSLTNEKLKQAAVKLREYRIRLDNALQSHAEAQKQISELKASKSLKNGISVAVQTLDPGKPQVRNVGCNTIRKTRRDFAIQTEKIVSPIDPNSEFNPSAHKRRRKNSLTGADTAIRDDTVEKKAKVDLAEQTIEKLSMEELDEIDRELASSEDEMKDGDLVQANSEKLEPTPVDEALDEAFASSISSDDDLDMDLMAAEIDTDLDTENRPKAPITDSRKISTPSPDRVTSATSHSKESIDKVQLSLSDSSSTSSSSKSNYEAEQEPQQTSRKTPPFVERSVCIASPQSVPQPTEESTSIMLQSSLGRETTATPRPIPSAPPITTLSAQPEMEKDQLIGSPKMSIVRPKSQKADLFKFRKLVQNLAGKNRAGKSLHFVQIFTLLETHTRPYVSSTSSVDRFCDSVTKVFNRENVSAEKALEAACMYFRSIRIGGKNRFSTLEYRSDLIVRVSSTLAKWNQKQARGSESCNGSSVDFQQAMYQCLSMLRQKIFGIGFDEPDTRRKSQQTSEKQLYWRAHIAAVYTKLSTAAFSVESARVFVLDLLFYEPNLRGLFLLRACFMAVPDLWYNGSFESDWVKSDDDLEQQSRDLVPSTILHIMRMIAFESANRMEEIGQETGFMILTALGEFVEDLKWTLEGVAQDANSISEWVHYLWAAIEVDKKNCLKGEACDQNQFIFEICTCFGMLASALKESMAEELFPVAKFQAKWEESMDERTRKLILVCTAHVARGLIQAAHQDSLPIPMYVTQVVAWYQLLLGSISEGLQRDCIVALVTISSHCYKTSGKLDDILGCIKCLAEWMAIHEKEALLLLPSACLEELHLLLGAS